MLTAFEIKRVHKILSAFCEQWEEKKLHYVVGSNSVQIYLEQHVPLTFSPVKKKVAKIAKQSDNGVWRLYCSDGGTWQPYEPQTEAQNIEILLKLVKQNPNQVFY